MKLFLFLVIMFSSINDAFATEEKSPWAHESEASIVNVSGNTVSESYSAKQKTKYNFNVSSFILAGRYLQSRSATTETAKAWDLSLRYERELSEKWAAFIQQGAESDVYGGYIQRDNSDLGGKYIFIKNESDLLFSELGARYIKTQSSSSTSFSTSARAYLEYYKKLNETLSAKAWVEYMPNFKEVDAWLLNYEPSLSVMMSQVFSLKLSYLVKFHNKTTSATEQKQDTTFTTSLVAKF